MYRSYNVERKWGVIGKMQGVLLFGFLFMMFGCQSSAENQKKGTEPHVVAESKAEAGRYLVTIGGCNDCHTAGYIMKRGNIPEDKRFLGSKVGWRGPWGTTYADNLRLSVQNYSADQWVDLLHTEKFAKLPMPWFNINKISEKDARAIYAYLKSLGPKGDPMPDPLPPEVEPKTPYISMKPQNMPKKGPPDTVQKK